MRSLIRIALRNVMRNRRRSLLTMSAVFLAVGVMVSVRGLLNGLQSSIREGVIRGQTGAVQVHKKGFLKAVQATPLELDIPADDAFLAKVAAVDGVLAAAPRISFGGMVNAHDTTVFALFFALDPAREPAVCPKRNEDVPRGRPLDPAQPTGSDLTDELLRRVGAKTGDTVALLTNDKDGVLNAIDVQAAGVIELAGLPLSDKKFAYIPLGAAQELLRMPGRATEIAVAVRDLDRADEVAARLRAALGDDYEVSTWHQMMPAIDDVIRLQDRFLGTVIYTFLFVALIGIANAMVMNVLERTREIGTMMAVGTRRWQIMQMFLGEAALLGLLGGMAGAAAGWALVLYYHHKGIPLPIPGATRPLLIYTFVSPFYIARVFLLAAFGAAIAALYPAWIASRLRPIEALSRS